MSLQYDCYNYFYSLPNKSATYVELQEHIESLNKYDLEYRDFEGVKYNFKLVEQYQILTHYNLQELFKEISDGIYNFPRSSRYFDSVREDIDTVKTNKQQLVDVFANHNEFKNSSDTDIYILSLDFFHINWIQGVSFFEYKHYILNYVKINVLDERLRQLYREITKEPGLYDEHYRKIASLDSMLGLLEYQELQHSLEESKEAKKEAKKANFLAITGIFLSVAGLVISIIVAVYQINQSEEQFNIEQKQYKKEHQESQKLRFEYTPINKVFINKK